MVQRPAALALSLALTLGGCASDAPRLMRMRSLSNPVALPGEIPSNGHVVGLSGLPRDAHGGIQANVLFVHGIGWTQDKSKLDFAADFISAIAGRFGIKGPQPGSSERCPRSGLPGSSALQSDPEQAAGGVRILSAAAFSTDYVHHRVLATEVACVDKTVIDLGSKGRVTVYRVLWDDLLYDAFQFPHIGYDDPLAPGQAPDPATEDLDRLRHVKNSELKTSVVTYGLNDAAMYFGPVGHLMRTAVGAALCLAIDDAAGRRQVFAGGASQHEANAACAPADGTSPPFAIVAESLGSRVVYDLLTDSGQQAPTVVAGARKRIGGLANAELEVFFLANQIPIFGVGRLGPPQATRRAWQDKPMRLVAISEVDDPLTYELVPYFEHLYLQRCRLSAQHPELAAADCRGMPPGHLAAELGALSSGGARKRLLQDLGFDDVTDVRVRFAKPFFRLYPSFISPLDAHTKHMTVPLIRDLLTCGGKDGVPLDC